MPKIRNFLRQIPDTSLRDVGTGIGKMLYRSSRPFAIRELAREAGVSADSMGKILTALSSKAYDQVGATEVTAQLGLSLADQSEQNRQILARLYETSPWVFICTDYIASRLSTIPLRIYRAIAFEDGQEVLENEDDSPVGRMFRWVNPYQSPQEFIEEVASWRLICGEAFVVFAEPGPFTPAGIPAEMYCLMSPFVDKMTTKEGGVVGYRYRVSGPTQVFHHSRVWRVGSFSPAGRWRGQGTPAAGYEVIQTDAALRRYNRRLIQDGVHLAGVLETDNEDLSPDEAMKIRKEFEATYGNRSATSNVAVLWGGLRFSPQTIMQKDMMMVEQRTADRDEICGLFGLKPELLTDKFSNKATAETTRRMAYEDVILGKHGKALESSLSSTALMLFDPNLRARFDASGVPAMQTGEGEKSEIGERLIRSGQMTINEVRSRIHGLPPIDGIEGDVPLINGMPIAAALGGGPDAVSNGKFVQGTVAGNLVKSASALVTVTKASDAAYQIAFDNLMAASEANGQRVLRLSYRNIEQEIIKAIPSISSESELLDALQSIYMRDGRVEVSGALIDAVRQSADQSVAMHLEQMALRGAFQVKPTRALQRLASQESRIKEMMGRRFPDLRATLTEGMQAGDSEAAIRRRVNEFFGGLRNNTLTVARTETLPAVNGSAIDVGVAARKAGVVVESEWRTNGDELVRRPPDSKFNHFAANGQRIIPGEQMFTIGGEHLEYPGDSWNGASPGNTIGCRCGIRNRVIEQGDQR